MRGAFHRCLKALPAWGALSFVAAPAMADDGTAKAHVTPTITVTAPQGFSNLLEEQRAVFDVFMGGVRVTTASASWTSASVRIDDPETLVSALPGIADAAAVTAALSEALELNRKLVCPSGTRSTAPDCGRLAPDVAGVIVDTAHYRIDVFVNPRLQTVKAAAARDFLPAPQKGWSLINAVSGVVTGSVGDPARFYMQDTAILGLGTARLRADVSLASRVGLQTDSMVAELDRPGLRYSAGAFWLPGNELLGRRKVLGIGIASQTDTRLDRDQFEGTPVILFLDERSRVDVVVDGRLASSRVYDAGNQGIDTSGLPEGSYDLVLRVTGASGRQREERRFFSRSRALPSLGTDRFFVQGGLLVEDSEGILGHVGKVPFAQAGWSRRLAPSLALRVGAIATDKQQWLEIGGTWLSRGLRLDAMAIANPYGDYGFFAHASHTGGGRLS